MPRLDAICKHWERVPPLAVTAAAIAAHMGIKRPAAAAKAEEQEKSGARQELFEMLGGAGFKTEKPEWLRAAMM